LSSCIPRKKAQAKKSPSVLSVETAYELTPSEASQKTKPAQNHFPEATAISHVKRHKVVINRKMQQSTTTGLQFTTSDP
jgi:hypothetical protein